MAQQMGDIDDQIDNLTDTDSGQASLTIAKAQYHSVDEQGEYANDRGSRLSAGSDLNLDAAGDIRVSGSDVIADSDASGSGDLNLNAGGDVIIEESVQTRHTQTKTIDGTAELNVVVRHQAVAVMQAQDQLEDARDQLKQAEEDYRQYQKDLNSLSDRRDQLLADYNAGIPGIAYQDIEILDQLISDIESDKDWHEAGIVLAAANLTSKTTLLTQQTAALVNSSEPTASTPASNSTSTPPKPRANRPAAPAGPVT